MDATTQALHDPMDYRKAEAGTLVGAFGCEEGVEYPFHRFAVHPTTGILNPQAEKAAGLHFGVLLDWGSLWGVDQRFFELNQAAPTTDRLSRVSSEVEDDLVDLGRISQDERRVRREASFDMDTGRDVDSEQLQRFHDDWF